MINILIGKRAATSSSEALIGDTVTRSRFKYSSNARRDLLFALALMMSAIHAPGQVIDPLDPEQVLQRMQKSVALTEDQVRVVRFPVTERCRSLRETRDRFRGKEGVEAKDILKEVKSSASIFQDAVWKHLAAEQHPSMKKFLAQWDSEIIREVSGTAVPAPAGKRTGGRKVSLAVSSPRFEDSPGMPAGKLADLKPTNEKSKQGEWAVAPFPLVSPSIGNGIVFVGAYMRRLSATDKVSPPSVFGAGGMYTSSKSWAVGYGQQLFLRQDRFRILSAFGLAQLNYKFSVAGSEAGAEAHEIPIHQRGIGFVVGAQVRTYERWYLGMQYHFIKAKTGVDLNEILPGLPIDIEPFALNIRLAGLMAQIERDSRDSQFYPKRGSFLALHGDFNEKDLGGSFNYQRYQVSYRGYIGFGKRQVLAYTASGCAVKGHVPFFELCMLGKTAELRGYPVGRYQGHRMLVGQAEYRLELPARLGIVGFMGAGEAADKWSDFNSGNIRPGGGLGLRFLLAKSNHVNLRLDYAWGKGSKTWYVGLGEAF